MFSNLSYQDKQAFFALLDEYFESRPHHRPGGGELSSSSAAPPVSFSSKPSSRPNPPAAPVRSVSAAKPTPPAAPVRATSQASNDSSPPASRPGSTPGSRQLGQAKGALDTGISKVVGNSTVKSGLNKFGAGNLAHKYSGGSTFKPTGNVPGPGERNLPPPPPGWKSGGGSGGGGGGAGAGGFGTGGYAEEKTPPAPAYSGAGRAQAAYDFEGGDPTDLPVRAGEVVTIVAKTSADWWTCQNASGRQGLVPANYMTEL